MKVPQISIIRFLNFGLKNEDEKQNILSFRYVLSIKKKYFEKKKNAIFGGQASKITFCTKSVNM